MGLKWIDSFMGDRTTCGHHRVQVQTGVWEMATCSAADSSSRCTEISWGRALCLSLISYMLPHTSSLPLGSLILPPWGQIGISVSSSSSSPNLMSLFEVSPLTELVVPMFSMSLQKKIPLCQGRPLVFRLARGNRWENFLFHGLAQMQSPRCSLADY